MESRTLWMRGSVSFVALRELLCFIALHPEGIRPVDMENWVRSNSFLRTQTGKLVSKTTIYHYRNTLLHLGIIKRIDKGYTVARENPEASLLFQVLRPGMPDLSIEEREMFARFVVMNHDCRRYFFDIFMPEEISEYHLVDFIGRGQPVAWKRLSTPQGRFEQLSNLLHKEKSLWIRSENERQAILYGVRYWARNQLGFLDEIFLEDIGGLMFPVSMTGSVPDPRILNALREVISPSEEWTIISLRRLVAEWGPKYRISIERLYQTFLWIYRRFPQYVVMIPTSEAFAAITAISPQAEAYHLRGYLQDEKGRYISHIRVHSNLREVILCQELLSV
jgi:hypothetical protein